MSYEQFLGQWQASARCDGCVNPYDPDAVYPEHREDEAWERNPIFDRHPDDFGEHPLAPLDRQVFEDCRQVQGKVVGRHEAVVRTPWYLTSQYLRGKLGCPVAQAAQLADSFAILDADAAMVETFLGWVKVRGLEAGLAYFSQLATAAAEAESVDPDDALHYAAASYQDWEHDRAVAERDDDLAAFTDLAWTPMGDEWAAVDAWLGRHSDDPDSDQAVGVDLSAAITEGWHLLDEPDEEPTWLEQQPARYQVLLHQVEAATDLNQLKRLGQKGYAATWFTRAQRQVFWSSWRCANAPSWSSSPGVSSAAKWRASKPLRTSPSSASGSTRCSRRSRSATRRRSGRPCGTSTTGAKPGRWCPDARCASCHIVTDGRRRGHPGPAAGPFRGATS